MTWLLLILSFAVTLAAQIYVRVTVRRYSAVTNARGLTGAEAAAEMLRGSGITNVRIEHISGSLTDRYDPAAQVISLSDDVYGKRSVAAVGIAMHEAGHAVQYAKGYAPVRLRNAIVGVTNLSSAVSYFLILAGMVLSLRFLITIGIIFFTAVIFFQLVTLPVEFNASGRAMRTLRETGLLTDAERSGAGKVLRAAALTYVGAVAVSLLQLARLLMLRGGRR